MSPSAKELSGRLARQAEAVCRHYLSSGHRQGSWWVVGDTGNNPGRSLFVRLAGPDHGTGAAGHWQDAATGQFGDLLDLIAATRNLTSWRDILDEARLFLGLPPTLPDPGHQVSPPVRPGSMAAARRLWGISRPVPGTIAETYLARRGITRLPGSHSLRFHPRCFYQCGTGASQQPNRSSWPALIAAVRGNSGALTGVHRTWLDPSGRCKAPLATPRRAMGHLLGQAVRFGRHEDVLAIGEGIETVLSLRQILPGLPAAAALSANHLAAFALPPTLRRLYIVRDADEAGRLATAKLASRARELGIETIIIDTGQGDLNDALRQWGHDELAAFVRKHLTVADAERFMASPDRYLRSG
ncbi:MAG: toprim domain-containing protein [Geminicoccaceae bacterium]